MISRSDPQLNVEIDERLKRRLKVTAARRGLPMREAVAEAIEAWLKQKRKDR